MLVERQLGIATEQCQYAADLLLRGRQLRLRQLQCVLCLLELRARADARLQQVLLALELVLLIGECGARGGYARELLPIGGLGGADLHARCSQLGLRLLHGDAKRPLVEAKQHLPALHGLVVVHVQLDHAAGNVGC